MKRALPHLLLVLLLLANPAAAEQPFLTAAALDLMTLLPPPPPPDSAAQQAELAAVIAAQHDASPERIALAVADNEETIFAMFARTLGPQFSAAALPHAAAFFARVEDFDELVLDSPKKGFARVRPWLASPAVKPLVPPSKSGSFPSGHTTQVTTAAIILAAMLPERRAAIWARATEYAESRVIGGMHYPLDLVGGQRAGTAAAAIMFANPEFRAECDAVRLEIRAALGL